MHGWLIVALALGYIAMLFAVAAYGDRRSRLDGVGQPRPVIYALSLAVYCTSWTFYGSVGLASTNGFEYLGIFIGPILVFTLGMPLLRRMMRLTKAERITSIADFIASRYGKNGQVAAVAALIAVVGTVPYIALQLKAISDSVTLMAGHYQAFSGPAATFELEASVFVTVMLAAFAILFGTRHADATEHQDGLILSVALESFVKLVVFIAVGLAVTFFMFGGAGPIIEAFNTDPRIDEALQRGSDVATWLMLTLLSASAILVLPRQYHVTFVENRSEDELKQAGWMLPVYLVLINLLVFPIAIAGMLHIGDGAPADLYVLALPLQAGHDTLALLTFTGGLSAATAMVIVASVALAIMVSNHLVIPLIIWKVGDKLHTASGDWADIILNVRRCAIVAIMFAAFAYYSTSQTNTALASIGILSFAALAQLTPALLFGLFWRGANARGAIMGMTGGFAVWCYCLLLPTLLPSESPIIANGLFGLSVLRPEAMFFLQGDPTNLGVLWSLLANVLLLVIGSRSRRATSLERIQAISFIPREQAGHIELKRFSTTVTNSDLKSTLARYIGQERMERAFWAFEAREGRLLHDKDPTDISTVRHAEQTLASALGSSSARLVLSLLLEKGGSNSNETVRLLDSASEAIQQNRDLLQTALDQLDQGISVFDSELRLTNWNGQFRRLLDLPPHMGQFGKPLKSILEYMHERDQIDDDAYKQALDRIPAPQRAWQMPLTKSGRVIEIRSNSMPDGGIVVTYSDMTAIVEAEDALRGAKQDLEARVMERTSELTRVNEELASARKTAEEANIGKTRFLAAAGHDITQPLNAARLYATSLVERMEHNDRGDVEISRKIDSALESVETIIGAVLDISRLDAGALKPSETVFPLQDMLEQLQNDFHHMASAKGIDLRFVKTSATIKTDRNLLRRLLQNLISNAIKYTKSGKVLVGVRRHGDAIRLHVLDTGIGIAPQKAHSVFREFERLQEGARISSGLGLGLSIVDRISKVLGLEITMNSLPGRGTSFGVKIPVSSEAVSADRSPDVIQSRTRMALSGLLVACIDNENDVLEGMEVLLRGWGASVVTGSNQDNLLSAIAEHGSVPDIIVADYHLDNNATGLEVIAAVRARLNLSIDAILATADRSLEVREEAKSKGVIVLNKPLKPAQLRALLSNASAQKRIAAE